MRLFWNILFVSAVAIAVHSLELSDPVTTSIEDIKLGESRYAIYMIKNGAFEVESTAPRTSMYADFVVDLQKNNPKSRYGLIDYQYIDNELPAKRLVMFLWSPKDESKKQNLESTSDNKDEIDAKFDFDDYIVAKTEKDLNEETLLSYLRSTANVAASDRVE